MCNLNIDLRVVWSVFIMIKVVNHFEKDYYRSHGY